MGCDIHLRLEKRLKKEKVWNKYYTEKPEWQNCGIINSGKTWSDRIYGMFAVLADVRNYWELEHLPVRGIPKDACNSTLSCYGKEVKDTINDAWEDGHCYLASKAEKWVSRGSSHYYELYGRKYCSSPDWHSASWCTTQEMEHCICTVFKSETGLFQGDPYEWLALLGAMKGYEATGEYECRAVFWFDN